MITILCEIPIIYSEGTYQINDLTNTDHEAIAFEHDTYGDTLTYTIPVGEDGRELVLYGIPKEEFLETASAEYDKTGKLKRICAQIHNEPALVYIHYSDVEDARQKIRSFAIETADLMVEKICGCTDIIARLFMENYYDGDAMDIHAKIGTAAQKKQIEKEYPCDKDVGDYPGNYPLDMMIDGDNQTLMVMIKCTDDDNGLYKFFQYAFDIMEERIKEKAIDRLEKTDDFKFLCMEYD